MKRLLFCLFALGIGCLFVVCLTPEKKSVKDTMLYKTSTKEEKKAFDELAPPVVDWSEAHEFHPENR